MKTKSLDKKENGHDKTNEAAGKVATHQQNGCCDCDDLYVCTNGQWDLWGTCSADAGIVPSKR